VRFEEYTLLEDGRARLRLNGNSGPRTVVLISINLATWEPLPRAAFTNLPAYLTDTKCPAAFLPGDDPALRLPRGGWISRWQRDRHIQVRINTVRVRFKGP